MGLDTTHDCWHGAYSAFSRWRNKLAEVAGYPFESAFLGPMPIVKEYEMTEARTEGEWDEVPDDPLIVLLFHSDCDGVIHPREGKALAKRIEELLPLLPTGDNGGGHIWDWQKITQRFIDGLREAASKNEDVEFH